MYSNIINVSVLLTIVLNAEGTKPIVETVNGKVLGKTLRTLSNSEEYHSFYGIPFAAPPVKDLRFKPPQPVQSWNDVLDATKEKPACVQYNNNVKKGQPMGQFGVEDCLYLDVFTPNIDKNRRPVLVFIYNVNFRNSFNKTKDYAPDFFIEEDLVFVSIAHRLAMFGFLSTNDEVIPPNAGLRDIVAGLKWIQSNIERFGGDPNKVTLMGVQGGAAAVDMLLHSNAKELFHSVILQGETSMSSKHLQGTARENAFKYAEVLQRASSNSGTLLKDLQKLSTQELLEKEWNAIYEDYFKEEQKGLLAFGPTVETGPDALLDTYPEKDIRVIDKPILIGFNSRDGLEASSQYLIEPRFVGFLEKDFPLQMPKRLMFKFNPFHTSFYDAVNDVKTFYFTDGRVKVRKAHEFITYIGDVLTGYSVDYTTKMYADVSRANVYYYNFDYSSALNENKMSLLKLFTVKDGTWGAAAGDELCYLFKCPDLIKEYTKLNGAQSEDTATSRKLVRMWANFVKFGNPTPNPTDETLQGIKWDPYTITEKQYLYIGKQIEMRTNLYEDRFVFWDKFITKWSRLAKNGVVTKSYKKNKLKEEL